MSDISFLVFEDDHGHYRLEDSGKRRVNMTPDQASDWHDKQAEPYMVDCPHCGQKHFVSDVDACPLAPHRYAVVRSFKNDAMSAPGFYAYHMECWPFEQTPTLTEETLIEGMGGTVRKVALAEIAVWATCCKCGQALVVNDTIASS